MTLTEMIISIFASYWNTLILFIPKLTLALIIILIGTIIGTIVKSFLKNVIIRYKLDEKLLLGKPVFKLSGIVSTLAAWFIYLVFIQAAIDVLGIPALSAAVRQILTFLPQIIEAIAVLFFGYIIAEFLKHHIEKMELTYARVIATVTFFIVIYISFIMALPIIGIKTSVLENLLLILVGTLGLGIALAVGLGLKDIVAEEAKKYRKKKRLVH